MKKILFIIALFCGFVANSQQLPGYTDINSRYRWLAGIFRALGLPAGSGPAAFTTGQNQQAGAVYYDSLGADAGFYIYNGASWVLQGSPSAVALPEGLIQPGYVTYSGTGLKFYVTPSVYRIDGIIYGTDQDSVTLSSADPDDPRKDVIYLATTGVEVLTGTPAGPAAEPQLEAGQIKLTVVDVPALATTPGITQQVLYDEGTESDVTGTGVTVNPASTTDVYRLTVAIDVGTLSNADVITLDAALPTLAWDLTGVNSLDGFIKLKAVMPAGGRLRIQLFNGSTAIGAEVNLVINKSFLDWQPFSIPISAMGNLASLSFTRVRIRYNTDAGNYAGFTLDYTYLQDGIVQPGPGGAVNSVTLQGPAGWTFTGPTTDDVIQTIIPGGTSTQMLGGDGVVKTDSTVKYIGTINSLTKSSNGATINTLTNEIVLQEADADDNGLLSEYDWRRFDTTANLSVENLDNTVDTLLTSITPFRSGIMGIQDSTGIGIHNNGRYLAFYATGGGGSGLFPTTGTGTATGAVVGSLDGNTLTVNQGANEFFHIDPTAGDEHAHLQAYNGTDLDNISTFTANTNNTSAIALFSASFNGSNKAADISALANATKSTLVYSADTNTVNGSVVISDLAGNGSGVVGVDNDGLLSFSAGGGGSGTVTNVATGYGVSGGPITTTGTIVADTTSADGLVSKDYLTDRIAEIDTANIEIERAGVGIQSWYNRGDTTLMLKDFKDTYALNWSTDTDSSLLATIDTFLIATKDRVTQVADSLGALIGSGGGANTALSNLAAVAVNTSLISDVDNTDDLGSSALAWKDAYAYTFKLKTALGGVATLAGTSSASNFTLTFPAITSTVATVGSSQTFTSTNAFSSTVSLLGIVRTNSTADNGNFHIPSSQGIGRSTTSSHQFSGSAGAGFRTSIGGGSVSTVLTANDVYAGVLFPSSLSTEGTSGTHAYQAGVVINPPNLSTGTAATTNASTFYIPGPPTGTAVITNPVTSFHIGSGIARFDGMFASGTTSLTANQIWGANSGATAMEGKTLTNGQNIKVTHGAGTATFAGATLTKNAMIENPTSTENIFIFRTPVAITVTDVTSVLVGSSTPSVTYNIAFGTDRTSLTNVYTAGQTVTSTTTGTAASGVNDNTIPAGSWVVLTTSAQSGTVGQLNTSITFTED